MGQDSGGVLGRGVYTSSDVERLTGVSGHRLRAWLFPPPRPAEVSRRSTAGQPLWRPSLDRVEGKPLISFMDLQQLRAVDFLHRSGFSLQHIRKALRRAREEWGMIHPLANKRLRTLGRALFLQIVTPSGDEALVELVHNQHAWVEILDPFLTDLDFSQDGSPVCWYPGRAVEGVGDDVILNPSRRFGRPIVRKSGIETWVLAQELEANGNAASVASWYDIPESDVHVAAAWEKHLAADRAA